MASCDKNEEVECRPVALTDQNGNPIFQPTDPNFYIYECYPEGCDCDTTLYWVEYVMIYGD